MNDSAHDDLVDHQTHPCLVEHKNTTQFSFWPGWESLRLPRHRAACARSRSLEHQLAFASISRKRCRALKLPTRLLEAAELPEEVAAHARQKMVSPERWFSS